MNPGESIFNVLYDDDIPTIAPGRLLSGSILNAALQSLVKSRPGSIALDPDLVNESMRGNATLSVNQLRATVASVSELGGQVFIPILIDHNHYILAVTNFTDRTVKVYDSRFNDRRPVFRVVTRIIPPSAPGERPWDRQYYACVQQENGNDCGVAVFLNSLHLLCDASATDLDHLPEMPARPDSIYWNSARAVILELCRFRAVTEVEDAARLIKRVEASLERSIHRTSDPTVRRREEQHLVLTKLRNEITTVNENDDAQLLQASEVLRRIQQRLN
ncbi:unnamed protein product [Discula destructiva]